MSAGLLERGSGGGSAPWPPPRTAPAAVVVLVVVVYFDRRAARDWVGREHGGATARGARGRPGGRRRAPRHRDRRLVLVLILVVVVEVIDVAGLADPAAAREIDD